MDTRTIDELLDDLVPYYTDIIDMNDDNAINKIINAHCVIKFKNDKFYHMLWLIKQRLESIIEIQQVLGLQTEIDQYKEIYGDHDEYSIKDELIKNQCKNRAQYRSLIDKLQNENKLIHQDYYYKL